MYCTPRAHLITRILKLWKRFGLLHTKKNEKEEKIVYEGHNGKSLFDIQEKLYFLQRKQQSLNNTETIPKKKRFSENFINYTIKNHR